MAISANQVRSQFYPDDWSLISALVKESNHYQCQACDRQCRRPEEPFDGHLRTLTVAHYDNVYEADWVLLVPLCVLCHLIHDAPFGWQARKRHERERRRRAGQLSFLYGGRAT